MIEHPQDPLLRLSSLHLLLLRQSLLVHDLHGVEPVVLAASAAEAAQIDGSDVAAPDPTDELEISKAKTGLPSQHRRADRLP